MFSTVAVSNAPTLSSMDWKILLQSAVLKEFKKGASEGWMKKRKDCALASWLTGSQDKKEREERKKDAPLRANLLLVQRKKQPIKKGPMTYKKNQADRKTLKTVPKLAYSLQRAKMLAHLSRIAQEGRMLH